MNYDNRSLRDDEDEILDDDLNLDAGSYPTQGETLPTADEITTDDSHFADESGDDILTTDKEEEPEYTEEESLPQPSKERRRSNLFKIKEEDNDDEDFYDAEPDEQKESNPKEKVPKLDPEDPDYWIDDKESPLENIFKKPRRGWKLWCAGIAIAVLLAGFAWIWFMHPYTDGAVKYGYLKHMERRGTVMKTFEGILIPYRELGDSTPFYFEEVRFSVVGDSLATRMKTMMLECVPVRLEYELYHSALPWKGCEKMIVVKVDTADTSKILPPEYR